MKTLEEKIVTTSHIRNKTFVSLVIFVLLATGAWAGWRWLRNQPEEAGLSKPLRKVLDANENIFNGWLSNNHLSRTYSLSAAAPRTRVNGDAGMGDDFDATNWRLTVIKAPGDTLRVTLNEIKALPKTDIVFDFKCIEGWSQVTHWGGVSFSVFAKKYGLSGQMAMAYTGLATPDNEYYVGIDQKSMLHPQTLLCYEMNGKTLPMNQGYPLRLIIPVKYGIKHIKRIGSMYFSNERPPDYWYERGYDYFSGL